VRIDRAQTPVVCESRGPRTLHPCWIRPTTTAAGRAIDILRPVQSNRAKAHGLRFARVPRRVLHRQRAMTRIGEDSEKASRKVDRSEANHRKNFGSRIALKKRE